MKKYLFLILFLVYPSLLYADMIYFKDGTSVEGKITSENDKLVTIRESKAANASKICEYPKAKIAKIEKKASKPTCNFSPRLSDKKNKAKDDKAVKETKVQAAKAPVKATKSTQELKPREIKKAEPAKPIKPVKEAAVKSKPKEVKPKEIKPKVEQLSPAKKIQAQEAAFKRIEKKTVQKTPKPLPASKPTPRPVAKPVLKKAAFSISVKPLKSAQEAELRKVEKAKLLKTTAEQQESSLKKTKAQEAAFKRIEKKTVQKTPEPAPVPKPAETAKEIVQEKKIILKYRTVTRDVRNLPEPAKMSRIESSIVVPVAADNEQLELIFADLLEKELAANKKLDALWVIVYVEEQYPNGLPKAYGIWSPPGGWYDWKNTSDKSQYKWEYRFLRGDSAPR